MQAPNSPGIQPEVFRHAIVEAISGARATDRWMVQGGTAREPWIGVTEIGCISPTQGWKLHVSASLVSALDVLERVLPVLLAESVVFKVVATPQDLYKLNIGEWGSSQVGKFITAYPSSDEQAVRLAVALDDATAGLAGPAVPSDRPLHPGSLVHYRYGAFSTNFLQTPLGMVVAALRAPDGSWEEDRRLAAYTPPAWAVDPFVAAGVTIRRDPVDLMVAGRYLTIAILNRSYRATVRLVVDTVVGEPRVLKQARQRSGVEGDGMPFVRLRREAEVLRRLQDNRRVPAVYELFEDRGDLFLVIEYFKGLNLEQEVSELSAESRFLSIDKVIAWGEALAALLGQIHEAGLIYCDIRPDNVIVTADADIRLVDYEGACWIRDLEDTTDVAGTPGFLSPQREASETPTVADDVYALGALLFFLATSVNPLHAPDPQHLLDRSPNLLNPFLPARLANLIARCLDPDATVRPASMQEIERELAGMGESGVEVVRGRSPAPSRDVEGRELALAQELVRALCREAVEDERSPGLCWRAARDGFGPPNRDIRNGAAGIVLTLAEAAPVFEDSQLKDVLAGGARWLASSPPLPGGPLAGLYVGEGGISAAILRAGIALDDAQLIEAALDKARLVSKMTFNGLDLFNGAAGRIRFHLAVWDATGESEHLKAAVVAGNHILATAEEWAPGKLQWRTPSGFGAVSEKALLGYAHGVAGIADALLDLIEASGDDRFGSAVRRAAATLRGQAEPALEDGSGLDWCDSKGGERVGAYWCHGAAGVGRFFLNAGLLALVPDGLDLARQAGRTVALGTRWAGPSQCHGLAGNAEFLLDLHRATEDPWHLESARDFGELLRPFAEAALRGPGPDSFNYPYFAPDYLTGYAGIAACLLRLSFPEQLPNLLGRKALGRTAPRVSTSRAG